MPAIRSDLDGFEEWSLFVRSELHRKIGTRILRQRDRKALRRHDGKYLWIRASDGIDTQQVAPCIRDREWHGLLRVDLDLTKYDVGDVRSHFRRIGNRTDDDSKIDRL